jgi:aspartate/methionine/tyrosine aminotransferase
VSYPDLVRVANGKPVVLPTRPESAFVHSGEEIAQAAARAGARGLVLNYPNNPSGAVPTREQALDIAAAAVAQDLWVLSDEIYGTMVYGERQHVPCATLPGMRERTLFVGGPTKSHSFTGWRVAFLAGPAECIAAAGRVQSQVIGNACTISQHAALAICEGDHRAELAQRMQSFAERRHCVIERVARMPGLQLTPPHGAFYALVDARQLCLRLGIDDVALAGRLLDEQQLAVVPGSPFAIPGFIRLSYAAALAELEEGLARLERFARSC